MYMWMSLLLQNIQVKTEYKNEELLLSQESKTQSHTLTGQN